MPKPAAKKTIAVDVDDVLSATATGFTKFSNERWGTRLIPDDYDEHWGDMWQISEKETMERRDEIVRAKLFMTLEFDKAAKSALKKLSENYKLVIATSRDNSIIKGTFDLVNDYYDGVFSEIHSAGIWDDLEKSISEKAKLTKAEICRQIGADYLIDDQPKHCIAVAEAGITAILFGDYRWNRHIKLTKNMVRAKNWGEVLEYFNAQSRRSV